MCFCICSACLYLLAIIEDVRGVDVSSRHAETALVPRTHGFAWIKDAGFAPWSRMMFCSCVFNIRENVSWPAIHNVDTVS
jgi:hypothetical protein